MKDDIFNARRQFRELNKVMEQLTYGEEVYRFELEPSRDPQLAAFYQVIVDLSLIHILSGGKWVYPHGDAATRVRDAVNAELKSRGMEQDARIFCELLNVEDESWQDCVEACLGDRRFDILVPPAHYAAAKSAFVALKETVCLLYTSRSRSGFPGQRWGRCPPRIPSARRCCWWQCGGSSLRSSRRKSDGIHK